MFIINNFQNVNCQNSPFRERLGSNRLADRPRPRFDESYSIFSVFSSLFYQILYYYCIFSKYLNIYTVQNRNVTILGAGILIVISKSKASKWRRPPSYHLSLSALNSCAKKTFIKSVQILYISIWIFFWGACLINWIK